MKENQGRIKAKEAAERLEDGYSFGKKNFKFKEKAFKAWHAVYIATALATVSIAVLLLAFGITNISMHTHPIGFLGDVADKVADFFVSIDFLVYDGATHAPGEDSDFVYVPPTTDKSNDKNDRPDTEDNPSTDAGASVGGLYDFDYTRVPEGYTPIIPMDLSLSSYGSEYINNSTGYSPDVAALIKKKLKDDNSYELIAVKNEPQILIIHTHGTEAYSKDGAIYCDDSEAYARTTDTEQNVVAVGKSVAHILNGNGINTLHCTVMHDSLQYKDSYARAEETVKRYMEEFPSIKLVIDIHRDSIIKSSGEIVRPVAELEGEAAAQLMCVVGSDWAGDTHPEWENNLSLALKLREKLNGECENICRPVFLKPNTYNQELAPFSLLVEVGAEGNSLIEAQRSAKLLADTLVSLLKEI